MDSYNEKLSLLLEMIAFAVVDGKLDKREYEFLSLIAAELQIEKTEFDELFHREGDPPVLKTEAQRIHQFYRLALLMYIDGKLHAHEEKAIYEIGLRMGLNPTGMKRILGLMENSRSKILDPNLIFNTFREQHN